MTERRLCHGLWILLLVGVAACGDATTPERGGDYVVTLRAPAGHVDGAAVIELSGAGVDTATALAGRVFMQRLADGVVRIVVVNDEPGAVRFHVRLTRGRSMPRASIIEVASADDEVRSDLSGYAVRFE